MAMAKRFVCGNCKHTIEAWDEGNPYFINGAGKKEYAYHPDHECLSRCIGNDAEHLCLGCGHEFMVDSLHPIKKCPKCGKSKIASTFHLEKRRCPFCKSGVFAADSEFMIIA